MEIEIQSWEHPKEIDWQIVEDNLFLLGEEVFRAFSRHYPDERVYGAVIELAQNWQFDVYLNTEEAIMEGIAAFRDDAIGEDEISDEEIRAMIGRWYYQSWKFSYLASTLQLQCPDLNGHHYEMLDRLSSMIDEKRMDFDLPRSFREAAIGAAQRIRDGEAVRDLKKTDDFVLKIADENGYDAITGGTL